MKGDSMHFLSSILIILCLLITALYIYTAFKRK